LITAHIAFGTPSARIRASSWKTVALTSIDVSGVGNAGSLRPNRFLSALFRAGAVDAQVPGNGFCGADLPLRRCAAPAFQNR